MPWKLRGYSIITVDEKAPKFGKSGEVVVRAECKSWNLLIYIKEPGIVIEIICASSNLKVCPTIAFIHEV